MKTRLFACLTLAGGILGMVIGKVAVQSYFDHQRATAFDRALVDTSRQLNASLPMQVDKYTRLDSTTPGPGNRFTYFYTISDVSSEGVDPAEVIKVMRPSIVNGYKTDPKMATFRDHTVEMHYVYRDKSGKHVGDIVVSPKDFR